MSDISKFPFEPCAGCTTLDICGRGAGCGRKMLEQAEALQKLAAFGAAVLKLGRIPEPADLDGFALQDLAVEHGVLVRQQVDGACSDNCACAQNGVTFPDVCYHIPNEIFEIVNKD